MATKQRKHTTLTKTALKTGQNPYICNMILLADEIQNARKNGQIVIEPFHEKQLSVNSYDLHLSDKMFALVNTGTIDPLLDISDKYKLLTPEWCEVQQRQYFTLHPNTLYLGSTVEYTETHGLIPVMEGKSSLGRMGIECHVCAGMGDDGFCGYWTLEIRVMVPTMLYVGMPIGQIIYHSVKGESKSGYSQKGSYNNTDNTPVIPNLCKKKGQFIDL